MSWLWVVEAEAFSVRLREPEARKCYAGYHSAGVECVLRPVRPDELVHPPDYYLHDPAIALAYAEAFPSTQLEMAL